MHDHAEQPPPHTGRPSANQVMEHDPLPDHVLLAVRDLRKYFPVRAGLLRRKVADVRALDGVSFMLKKGETLGVAGESGCGKTTLAQTITRLTDPTSGTALLRSQVLAAGQGERVVDLAELRHHELKLIRREIQLVFQDPNSSLNPRLSIKSILEEPFVIHKALAKSALEDRIAELLEAVGLEREHMNRYPHEFSGGQKQRIGVARALALNPRLVLADEPVSALDVSIQGQLINLFEELQDRFHLTYIFIAHDLSVIFQISTTVAIMYLGKIVELASAEDLFQRPLHPYTEALLSALPQPDPLYVSQTIVLEGSVPSPINPPSGCRFHPRCRYAKDICRHQEPELREVEGHSVSCHFAEELDLSGVEYANFLKRLKLL